MMKRHYHRNNASPVVFSVSAWGMVQQVSLLNRAIKQALLKEQQLSKWQNEGKLSLAQQMEITRFQEQVKEWDKVVMDILSLAEELKTGTIEKAIQKSDLEQGD